MKKNIFDTYSKKFNIKDKINKEKLNLNIPSLEKEEKINFYNEDYIKKHKEKYVKGSSIMMDLSKVQIDGDILDIGEENYGIIYNLSKTFDDEVCIDYYEGGEIPKSKEKFDNAILFFNLSKVGIFGGRDKLIEQIYNLLIDNGCLYIWDYEKNFKEVVNKKITVKLPDNFEKDFNYKDLNFLNKFTIEDGVKLVEKYFFIEEIQVCDKIYFIKCKRKGSIKDEGIINSSKLKVYP